MAGTEEESRASDARHHILFCDNEEALEVSRQEYTCKDRDRDRDVGIQMNLIGIDLHTHTHTHFHTNTYMID